MVLQQIFAIWMGFAFGVPAATATTIITYNGLTSDEEKYLQYNLRIEEWIEEEKRKENEIALVKSRWDKRCRWEETISHESFVDKSFGLGQSIFKCSHWLREKVVSAEVQKEELKTLIENVRMTLQVLKDTREHNKEELAINQAEIAEEDKDYEVISKEVTELEKEIEAWEKILAKLESRLESLSQSWINRYFQKKAPDQSEAEREIFSDALECQEREIVETAQDQQAQILQPAYGTPGSSKN